jgi:hypothetical protein
MEILQENSLCSYLYLKLSKMSCFSFYHFSFFLLKNQRTGGLNRFCPEGRIDTSRRKEEVGKGGGR